MRRNSDDRNRRDSAPSGARREKTEERATLTRREKRYKSGAETTTPTRRERYVISTRSKEEEKAPVTKRERITISDRSKDSRKSQKKASAPKKENAVFQLFDIRSARAEEMENEKQERELARQRRLQEQAEEEKKAKELRQKLADMDVSYARQRAASALAESKKQRDLNQVYKPQPFNTAAFKTTATVKPAFTPAKLNYVPEEVVPTETVPEEVAPTETVPEEVAPTEAVPTEPVINTGNSGAMREITLADSESEESEVFGSETSQNTTPYYEMAENAEAEYVSAESTEPEYEAPNHVGPQNVAIPQEIPAVKASNVSASRKRSDLDWAPKSKLSFTKSVISVDAARKTQDARHADVLNKTVDSSRNFSSVQNAAQKIQFENATKKAAPRAELQGMDAFWAEMEAAKKREAEEARIREIERARRQELEKARLQEANLAKLREEELQKRRQEEEERQRALEIKKQNEEAAARWREKEAERVRAESERIRAELAQKRREEEAVRVQQREIAKIREAEVNRVREEEAEKTRQDIARIQKEEEQQLQIENMLSQSLAAYEEEGLLLAEAEREKQEQLQLERARLEEAKRMEEENAPDIQVEDSFEDFSFESSISEEESFISETNDSDQDSEDDEEDKEDKEDNKTEIKPAAKGFVLPSFGKILKSEKPKNSRKQRVPLSFSMALSDDDDYEDDEHELDEFDLDDFDESELDEFDLEKHDDEGESVESEAEDFDDVDEPDESEAEDFDDVDEPVEYETENLDDVDEADEYETEDLDEDESAEPVKPAPVLFNRRKYDAMLGKITASVLVLFLVLNTALPDHKMSEIENRELKQAPKLSMQALADGSYADKVESWQADQFTGRSVFRNLQIFLRWLGGDRYENGVYQGKNGQLLEEIVKPNEELLKGNIASLNAFAEKYQDKRMTMMLVPDTATIINDAYPAFAEKREQSGDFSTVSAMLSDRIQWTDLVDTMKSHTDEKLYYKTDHHWTSLGAYYGYQKYCETVGLEPGSFTSYPVSVSFNGVLSSTSGFCQGEKESIEIYEPETETKVIVNYLDEQRQSASLFDKDKLNTKDQYALFMGGNYSVVDIKTSTDNANVLLLFKDSFANSMLPFLVTQYSEIVVVDPRYYYGDADELMSSYKVTDVAFLYSGNTFMADSNLQGIFGEVQSEVQPEGQSEVQPEVQSEVQPEGQSEVQPEGQSEEQSKEQTDVQPEE